MWLILLEDKNMGATKTPLIGAATPQTAIEARKLAEFLGNVDFMANDGDKANIGTAMDSIRKSQSGDADKKSGLEIPLSIQTLFDTMEIDEKKQNRLIGLAMDACKSYVNRHNRPVSPDVLAYAFKIGQNLESCVKDPSKLFGGYNFGRNVAYDSIFSNEAHNQLSMQPNRAVVSIIGAIAEAIPIAAYLPVDLGSNEARLIIVNAQSGNDFGGYRIGDSMMGADMGEPYLIPERFLRLSSNGGATFPFAFHRDLDTSDMELADTGSPAVKIYGGRTTVYVNGMPCGTDATLDSPSISNSLHGNVTLGSTSYGITGTVNSQTGVGTVTFTPALPANTYVHVEGVINYEDAQESLMPTVGIKAESFRLYATPSRSSVVLGIDSATQFANEVGIDPISTATMNVRSQYQTERHNKVLAYARALARAYPEEFQMDWSVQGTYKSIAEVVRDISSALNLASQKMVIRTNGIPLTTIYVGERMLAVLNSLPPELFAKSTAPQTANIRYSGFLFGQYYVYFDPKATETTTESSILGVGTHAETARNPIVFGDAVPMMMIPVSTSMDLKQRQAWYSRQFTKVTPYKGSQSAFCVINVSGMPVR